MATFDGIKNYTSAQGFGMALDMRRGNPLPLDHSSVWTSLADAQNYAATDPTAYVGQVLSVVTETDDGNGNVTYETKVYAIIDAAGTLKEVGANPTSVKTSILEQDCGIILNGGNSIIAGDNTVIIKDSNGKTVDSVELYSGNSYQIVVNDSNGNPITSGLSYSSTNPNITVSSSGLVTVNATGNAASFITVYLEE